MHLCSTKWPMLRLKSYTTVTCEPSRSGVWASHLEEKSRHITTKVGPAEASPETPTSIAFRTGAGGGSRTHTALRPMDFESTASAIPPLRRADILGYLRDPSNFVLRFTELLTASCKFNGARCEYFARAQSNHQRLVHAVSMIEASGAKRQDQVQDCKARSLS